MYDSNKNLIKVNEVFEFIGILDYNPYLDEVENHVDLSSNGFENFNLTFPSVLIPRLHCLSLKKVTEKEQEQIFLKEKLKGINNLLDINTKELYQQFLNVFNLITFNDELVSQFILFAIINYNHEGSKKLYLETIEKLIINIYKCSKINFYETTHPETIWTFPQILSKILEKLVSKSVYLPLELSDLDKSHFISTKNYENNVLEIGKLQMTSNTILCIDETKMSAGTLKEKGLRNLHFLNDLLENQVLNFDFSYQETKIPCACNALILSEGKSFLKSNINVI